MVLFVLVCRSDPGDEGHWKNVSESGVVFHDCLGTNFLIKLFYFVNDCLAK